MSKAKGKTAAGSGSSSSSSGSGSVPPGAVTLVLPFASLPIQSHYLERISAFVEDPRYAGQPLAKERLLAEKCPAHRYAGHNFTLAAFTAACNALAPLSAPELVVQRAINEAVKGIRARAAGAPLDVYVIAHLAADDRTYAHERCHAIFHYCPEYRKRVAGIWSSAVQKGAPAWGAQFTTHLNTMYHSSVHLDEFQAIVLCREYECSAKTVSLLQAAMPADKELPFTMQKVVIDVPASVVAEVEANTAAEKKAAGT